MGEFEKTRRELNERNTRQTPPILVGDWVRWCTGTPADSVGLLVTGEVLHIVEKFGSFCDRLYTDKGLVDADAVMEFRSRTGQIWRRDAFKGEGKR